MSHVEPVELCIHLRQNFLYFDAEQIVIDFLAWWSAFSHPFVLFDPECS
jgi:hypothetical protein